MFDDYSTLPLKDFCKWAGIGPTLCREMLADGRLRAIRAGRKLLIEADSWREYAAKQLREGMPEYNKTRAAVEARKANAAARRAEGKPRPSLEELGL